jgi:hypothetical protein
MPGQCGRPGCTSPASATVTLDRSNQTVWVDRVVERSTTSAARLCVLHADALTPPRGWQLRDRRRTRRAATSRSARRSLTALPRSSPSGAVQDPLDALLEAKTPLLSRAFRGARAS